MKKLIIALVFAPVAVLVAGSIEWSPPAGVERTYKEKTVAGTYQEIPPPPPPPPEWPDYLPDLPDIAHKVEVLWTAHTNRLNRVERAKKMREARNKNGRPPVKPFKVQEGAKR